MRSIAILGGVLLVLAGAAASGAALRSSSSAGSALLAASATRTHSPHVAKVMLLGNRAIESTVNDHLVGSGEAFVFRARRGGTATAISVYLDKRDRAGTVYAGLYTSRDGHPQSLLTSGSRRSSKAGAWNSLPVRSVRLQSGATYWLAVLGKVERCASGTEPVARAPARVRRCSGCSRFPGPGTPAPSRTTA